MTETITSCYCCGTNNFSEYLKAKDNYGADEFIITACNNCGFKFTNPRPTENTIAPYYAYNAYMSHNSHSKSMLSFVYRLARKYMMGKKLRLIKNHVGSYNFSMLDFGCGTGDFLAYCNKNGIETQGYETDENARKIATEVNNVNAYSPQQINDIPAQKYDAISLWHVLEHIHKLDEQIELFKKWLKPEGLVFIAVPNSESYDAKYYKQNWDALDVPRHLYHFSPAPLKLLMEKHSFKFEAKYPLILDAFYISMRSEWHKGTGKLPALFKAIINGIKSNNAAKKTGDYSSLIYVFRSKVKEVQST
jgi:2-polyprenyl-3-methyl-5-hydroxy-6-metoxy-1,4-benzoquinol methylase